MKEKGEKNWAPKMMRIFFQSNQRLRPLKAFEGRPGLTKMQQMSLKNLGSELWNAFFLQRKVPPLGKLAEILPGA